MNRAEKAQESRTEGARGLPERRVPPGGGIVIALAICIPVYAVLALWWWL